MERLTKSQYYIDIARSVAMRSTCIRRRVGAVIVKNDQIISTGYNGAPRRAVNCTDLGYCVCGRDENAPFDENHESCRAVHAEMNAIIHASRLDMVGSDMYLAGIEVESGRPVDEIAPCLLCKRVIMNAGIARIIIRATEERFKYIDVDDLSIEERISAPL
ncbi:MAG: dCMP deaminase family protein [Syntrophobacteraceae bacterium]|nr:dCMP deaminase family protein [Desulfobacteraceae bacterium]